MELAVRSAMVKLFVSDIDGCLAQPYHPLDLAQFGTLAGYIQAAGLPLSHPDFPSFSICTGRPFPYAEAIAQALGVQAPLIFESGGGMYNPKTGKISWNPGFTADLQEQVDVVKHWMVSELVPGSAMNYDYAKRTQPGVPVGRHPLLDGIIQECIIRAILRLRRQRRHMAKPQDEYHQYRERRSLHQVVSAE